MRVLVPYDGSEQSAYALELAADRFPDATVVLAHVLEPFADHTEAAGYTPHRYEQEIDRAESMLEKAAESLGEKTVETVIQYGRPPHKIVSIAEQEDVDEIVMGSHGRDGAKRLLLGSVAESVVRGASVPVTVVRQRAETTASPPERVLVPFDGSEEAKEALLYAIDRYPDVEITALYAVYPPPDVTPTESGLIDDAIEDWAQDIDDYTRDVLKKAKTIADGRPIETATVDGDPARGIVEFAEDHEFDHVVIGTHGRGGLKRLLLGSVAETVVRRAPTSVTVVR